ncbi:hypothetical protein LL240_01085 [Oceanimonas baumannii]|uniref:hypothetical protein n=1 Tax=Oceanimonas baumannii TaxID=129578 RepID=UPI001D180AD5|nr:hypothetical protein [Oceanimonas baumannii]MCC4263054.1 hypothetical protein [Oceanimonas baumannii]
MELFLTETLKPSIFWSAISALGTMLAVCIAIFLPSIQKRYKVKKMTQLINLELSECMENIIRSEQLDGLPDQAKPSARVEFLKRIKLDIWDAHSHSLLAESPDRFLPYRDIFGLLLHIKNTASQPSKEAFAILDYDVKSFKEKYEKMFPNE